MLVTDGDYRDGDVALIKARWWLQLFGVKYDHAAILWWHYDLFTVEAGLTGVRAYKFGHWPRPFDVYRPDGTEDAHGAGAVVAALSTLGDRYAFEHLPYVLWRIWNRPVSVLATVCSELVGWSWQQAGIDLCPGIKYPSPDDLYDALKGE